MKASGNATGEWNSSALRVAAFVRRFPGRLTQYSVSANAVEFPDQIGGVHGGGCHKEDWLDWFHDSFSIKASGLSRLLEDVLALNCPQPRVLSPLPSSQVLQAAPTSILRRHSRCKSRSHGLSESGSVTVMRRVRLMHRGEFIISFIC